MSYLFIPNYFKIQGLYSSHAFPFHRCYQQIIRLNKNYNKNYIQCINTLIDALKKENRFQTDLYVQA